MRSILALIFLVGFFHSSDASLFGFGNFKKCSKKHGNFPKPGSLCRSYYECKNWKLKELTCPQDQHFFPARGRCVWQEEYPCIEKPLAKECLLPNGKFLKPGTGCKKYYDCYKGVSIEKRCSSFLLFDHITEKCDYPEFVHCPEPEVVSTTEKTSSPSMFTVGITTRPTTDSDESTSKEGNSSEEDSSSEEDDKSTRPNLSTSSSNIDETVVTDDIFPSSTLTKGTSESTLSSIGESSQFPTTDSITEESSQLPTTVSSIGEFSELPTADSSIIQSSQPPTTDSNIGDFSQLPTTASDIGDFSTASNIGEFSELPITDSNIGDFSQLPTTASDIGDFSTASNIGEFSELPTTDSNIGDFSQLPTTASDIGDFSTASNIGEFSELPTTDSSIRQTSQSPITDSNIGDYSQSPTTDLNVWESSQLPTTASSIGESYESPSTASRIGEFSELPTTASSSSTEEFSESPTTTSHRESSESSNTASIGEFSELPTTASSIGESSQLPITSSSSKSTTENETVFDIISSSVITINEVISTTSERDFISTNDYIDINQNTHSTVIGEEYTSTQSEDKSIASTSTMSESTDSVTINIFCPEADGYFPHPNDKHKFIACVAGDLIIMDCPSNLVYVHKKKACDYEKL